MVATGFSLLRDNAWLFKATPQRVFGAVDLKRLFYLKKIISLVIYIFRGHIRAHMKSNEMLFEIIYSDTSEQRPPEKRPNSLQQSRGMERLA